jgi:hypothetical protein
LNGKRERRIVDLKAWCSVSCVRRFWSVACSMFNVENERTMVVAVKLKAVISKAVISDLRLSI